MFPKQEIIISRTLSNRTRARQRLSVLPTRLNIMPIQAREPMRLNKIILSSKTVSANVSAPQLGRTSLPIKFRRLKNYRSQETTTSRIPSSRTKEKQRLSVLPTKPPITRIPALVPTRRSERRYRGRSAWDATRGKTSGRIRSSERKNCLKRGSMNTKTPLSRIRGRPRLLELHTRQHIMRIQAQEPMQPNTITSSIKIVSSNASELQSARKSSLTKFNRRKNCPKQATTTSRTPLSRTKEKQQLSAHPSNTSRTRIQALELTKKRERPCRVLSK